jgi:predicted  nucleic acid-binding Zn-ribbon protein
MLRQDRQGQATLDARVAGIKKVFAQGAIGAGVGAAVPAPPQARAVAAAVGFFGGMGGAAVDYYFQAPPELKYIVGKNEVECHPGYFGRGLCPDLLLNREARIARDEAYRSEKEKIPEQQFKDLCNESAGRVLWQIMASAYPLEKVNGLYPNDEVLRALGENFMKDKAKLPDTKHLLENRLQELSQQQHENEQRISEERRDLTFVLLEIGQKIEDMQQAQQEAQAIQARFDNARQAADGIAALGEHFTIPFLEKVGRVGGALINLEQSINKTMQGLQMLQQGGFQGLAGLAGAAIPGLSAISGCFSFLAGPVGIFMAGVSLFEAFNEAEQQDGLGEALGQISGQIAAIHQAVHALHEDMRGCFDATWDRLEQMQEFNCRQFKIVLESIDKIRIELEKLDKIRHDGAALRQELQAGFQRVEAHLQFIENAHMNEAFIQFDHAKPEKFLEDLTSGQYVNHILLALKDAAILPENSGTDVTVPAFGPSVAQTKWIQRLQKQLPADPINKLGFYHRLVAGVLPALVANANQQDLVGEPHSWLQAVRAYESLLRTGQDAIADLDEAQKVKYRQGFLRLKAIAKTNVTVLQLFTQEHNLQRLLDQLILNYKNAVDVVHDKFNENFNTQQGQLAQTYPGFSLGQDVPSLAPTGMERWVNLSAMNMVDPGAVALWGNFGQANWHDLLNQVIMNLIAQAHPDFHGRFDALWQDRGFLYRQNQGNMNIGYDHVVRYSISNHRCYSDSSSGGGFFGDLFNSSSSSDEYHPVASLNIEFTFYLVQNQVRTELCYGSMHYTSQADNPFALTAGLLTRRADMGPILAALPAVPTNQIMIDGRKAMALEQHYEGLLENLKRRYLELINVLAIIDARYNRPEFKARKSLAKIHIKEALTNLRREGSVIHLEETRRVLETEKQRIAGIVPVIDDANKKGILQTLLQQPRLKTLEQEFSEIMKLLQKIHDDSLKWIDRRVAIKQAKAEHKKWLADEKKRQKDIKNELKQKEKERQEFMRQLQMNIRDLQRRITAIEEKIAGCQEEITRLKTEISRCEQAISDLERQIEENRRSQGVTQENIRNWEGLVRDSDALTHRQDALMTPEVVQALQSALVAEIADLEKLEELKLEIEERIIELNRQIVVEQANMANANTMKQGFRVIKEDLQITLEINEENLDSLRREKPLSLADAMQQFGFFGGAVAPGIGAQGQANLALPAPGH